ncbi:hypothetical protein BDV09DRAFT_185443 [Aspergillus tetrazonus]
MLFHSLLTLTTLLVLAVTAAAAPHPPDSQSTGHPWPRPNHGLPPCNEVYRPCRCPPGTTFKNLTTFGIIGAPAIDVQRVLGDFPISVTGDGHVPGATRTFNFTVPNAGSYLFTEELVEWTTTPDGSFTQVYQQSPNPPVVEVPGGGGSFNGMWQSVTGQQTVIANETAISWKNWRCDVGEPFPAAASHEIGIMRASEILDEMGLRTGVDIPVFSIFYEPEAQKALSQFAVYLG